MASQNYWGRAWPPSRRGNTWVLNCDTVLLCSTIISFRKYGRSPPATPSALISHSVHHEIDREFGAGEVEPDVELQLTITHCPAACRSGNGGSCTNKHEKVMWGPKGSRPQGPIDTQVKIRKVPKCQEVLKGLGPTLGGPDSIWGGSGFDF